MAEDYVARSHSDHDGDTWEFAFALTCLKKVSGHECRNDMLDKSGSRDKLTWLKALL